MKKYFLSFLMGIALSIPVMFTSCDDGNDPTVTDPEAETLSGSVRGTETLTLDASKEYTLNGPLLVEDGGTLTIPAGTVIKAKKGFSSYILVLQGGKININGTATNPVILTSDEANPKSGDWGGLIINGRAPLSGNTEGSTEISPIYVYGGNNVADNSGSISYLQLLYTGAQHPTDADIEHNGLTLNGVGSGTTIKNIYIAYGMDDGIEFFGGSVNVENLLVVNPDDDMFDMTQGWTGKLTNCYGIWEQGYSSNESDASGVEADGNLDGNTPDQTGQSNFTITNMTIDLRLAASTDTKQQMNNVIKVRRGATANISNALVKGTGNVKSTGFIVDMTDGKGNGSGTINITDALVNKPAVEVKNASEFPGATVGGNNTGCATGNFGWTGYKF